MIQERKHSNLKIRRYQNEFQRTTEAMGEESKQGVILLHRHNVLELVQLTGFCGRLLNCAMKFICTGKFKFHLRQYITILKNCTYNWIYAI